MYLLRNLGNMEGVFAAKGYLNKRSGSCGLKINSYFITEEICQVLEDRFARKKRKFNSRSTGAKPSVSCFNTQYLHSSTSNVGKTETILHPFLPPHEFANLEAMDSTCLHFNPEYAPFPAPHAFIRHNTQFRSITQDECPYYWNCIPATSFPTSQMYNCGSRDSFEVEHYHDKYPQTQSYSSHTLHHRQIESRLLNCQPISHVQYPTFMYMRGAMDGYHCATTRVFRPFPHRF